MTRAVGARLRALTSTLNLIFERYIMRGTPEEKTMKPVHHIPKGYNSVTPYLIIKGAAQAIELLQEGFRSNRSLPHGWIQTDGSVTPN